MAEGSAHPCDGSCVGQRPGEGEGQRVDLVGEEVAPLDQVGLRPVQRERQRGEARRADADRPFLGRGLTFAHRGDELVDQPPDRRGLDELAGET